MLFLHDDSLLASIYHAQKARKGGDDNEDHSNEADEESGRMKRMIAHGQLNTAHNSHAETFAILVGVCFVGAVAMFALYAGSSMNGETDLNIFTFKDSPAEVTKNDDFNINALQYILYLNPDRKKKVYTGLVKIKFQCTKETSQIILNARHHVNITKVAVKTFNTTDIEDYTVTKRYHNMNNDLVIMDLNKALVPTVEYHIFIGFHSNLTSLNKHGIYYMDAPSPMILGVFEHKLARQIFPCFDRFADKATFQLILQHNANFNAVSNMPLREKVSIDKSDRVESYFFETPMLSTELLCFVIMKQTEQTLFVGKTKVNMYSPFAQSGEITIARAMIPLFYNYYQNLFGYPGDLQKIDFVPVPHLHRDVIGSYGIVLIREENFLYNDNNGSPAQLEMVAGSLAHGLVSQYFLNFAYSESCYSLIESLKMVLQYAPIQHYYPSWNISTQYYVDMMYSTLIDDSFAIQPFFYNQDKGVAVMHMLQRFIGEPGFFRGVKDFLKEEKGDEDTEYCQQLELSMTKVSTNFDFMEYMKSWSLQSGFPLLNVNIENSQFKVEQSRFFYLNEEDSNGLMSFWRIPLQFTCNNSISKHELVASLDRFALTESCKDENLTWYLANTDGLGYYRTNYEEKNWLALLKQMKEDHTIFTPTERTSILSDIFAFTYSGTHSVKRALSFTTYLNKETSEVPFYVALQELKHLKELFKGSNVETCFKNYLHKKALPIFDKLYAMETLNHSQKKLLSLVSDIIVTEKELTNGDLLIKLDNIFLKWLVSTERLNLQGELKYTLSKVGVESGNHFEWDSLLQYYINTKSMVERDLVLKSLSLTTDKKLLERYMTLLNDSLLIDPMDKIKALSYTCLNGKGRQLAWNETVKDIDALFIRHENDLDQFHDLFNNCLGSLHTSKDLSELLKFQASVMKYNSINAMLKRMIKKIEINIAYLKNIQEVKEWFQIEDPTCL